MRIFLAACLTLALSGCGENWRKFATCENAQTALDLAQDAVNRLCQSPAVNILPPPPPAEEAPKG
jgi:hypothetical protein